MRRKQGTTSTYRENNGGDDGSAEDASQIDETDNSRGGREGEVKDFLNRFARVVTAGDGRGAASHWAVPALIVKDDGVKAVTSLQEVEQFFSGAKEQDNSRGITDTRADVQRLEWATEKIAIVDVRWPYLTERGEEKGEEASTYILRRDDTGTLKVHVALMRGASTPD